MRRVLFVVSITAAFLAVACGGGGSGGDQGPKDAIDIGQADSVGDSGGELAVGDEGRDAGDQGASDHGKEIECHCSKDEDCEPRFPDLGQCEKAYCDPASCQCEAGFIKDGTACNDEDPCTDGDACKAGECVPGQNQCDCTSDEDCELYEDANLCNGTLYCDIGSMPTVCLVDPETIIQCNDDLQLPCMTKECVPETGECAVINTNEGLDCDDGNQCTENDMCIEGECKGENTVVCDDENPCTDDACVFGKGCVFAANSEPCDDGNICTLADTCSEGECVPGEQDTCDDLNSCTVDLQCVPGTGCAHQPYYEDPSCVLVVEFDSPERAATLDGDAVVQVTGHVISPAGDATDLTVTFNGQAETVTPSAEDGKFSLDVTAVQGLNTLEALVSDEFGRRDHAARSFYYSTEWYGAGSAVDDGLLWFMGPDAWDDDDTSDMDDMATLLGLFAQGFDVSSFVTNPVHSGTLQDCQFEISVLDVTFDDLEVDLIPLDGGIHMSFTLNHPRVQIALPMVGPGCVDMSGWLDASTASVEATIEVTMTDGVPAVAVSGAEVKIPDLALVPNCEPHCELMELLRLVLIAAAQDQLISSVPGLLEEALSSTIDENVNTGELIPGGWPDVPLAVSVGFSSIGFSDNGSIIGLNVSIESENNAGTVTLGSIGRAGCLGDEGKIEFPNAAGGDVEVAMHDDLFNELPFVFHRYGAFVFPITDDQIQAHGIDLSEIGMNDVDLEVRTMLPPISTSCNETGRLDGQIGDVEVTVDMSMNGAPVKVRLYISLAAEAVFDVSQSQDGTVIGLSPEVPHTVVYDLKVLEGDPGMTENELFEYLDEELKPQLMVVFGGLNEDYVVPQIDIGGYISKYLAGYLPSWFPVLPAGTVLDMTLDDVLRAFGRFVVTGGGI